MQSVLKDIYLGNRGNESSIKQSSEYWQLINQAAEISEKLSKVLTEEHNGLLREWSDLQGKMEAEVGYVHFKEGYALGLLTAFECINK